jgi:hypothetical protein
MKPIGEKEDLVQVINPLINMSKITSKWAKTVINDLSDYTNSMMSGFKLYKCKDKFEKMKMEEYFDIEYSFDLNVCYSLNNKQKLRKIKLNILENSRDALFLKYVLHNSKDISVTDVLEHKLSYELSKSIDNEIMKNIRNMVNPSEDLH